MSTMITPILAGMVLALVAAAPAIAAGAGERVSLQALGALALILVGVGITNLRPSRLSRTAPPGGRRRRP